jgi:hypothetical protein
MRLIATMPSLRGVKATTVAKQILMEFHRPTLRELTVEVQRVSVGDDYRVV